MLPTVPATAAWDAIMVVLYPAEVKLALTPIKRSFWFRNWTKLPASVFITFCHTFKIVNHFVILLSCPLDHNRNVYEILLDCLWQLRLWCLLSASAPLYQDFAVPFQCPSGHEWRNRATESTMSKRSSPFGKSSFTRSVGDVSAQVFPINSQLTSECLISRFVSLDCSRASGFLLNKCILGGLLVV